MNRIIRHPFLCVTLVDAVVLALTLLWYGATQTGAIMAARLTARVSLVTFAFAFTAAAW